MIAVVNVSKSALFELVMAAFEAYAIKHERNSEVAIETFAHLWGSYNKKGPFKCNVEHVSVETSAKRKRGSVQANTGSFELKQDIASVFGEGYAHLGNFHTHPWVKTEVENAQEIRRQKLFDFSESDHKSEMGWGTITVGKKSYSVALVMTIFAMERANDQTDGFREINLNEFSMGNIKLWLKAQVFEHKPKQQLTAGEIDEFSMYGLDISQYDADDVVPVPVSTNLKCPFLESMGTYLQGFGRLEIDDKSAYYRRTEDAEKRFWHFA